MSAGGHARSCRMPIASCAKLKSRLSKLMSGCLGGSFDKSVDTDSHVADSSLACACKAMATSHKANTMAPATPPSTLGSASSSSNSDTPDTSKGGGAEDDNSASELVYGARPLPRATSATGAHSSSASAVLAIPSPPAFAAGEVTASPAVPSTTLSTAASAVTTIMPIRKVAAESSFVGSSSEDSPPIYWLFNWQWDLATAAAAAALPSPATITTTMTASAADNFYWLPDSAAAAVRASSPAIDALSHTNSKSDDSDFYWLPNSAAAAGASSYPPGSTENPWLWNCVWEETTSSGARAKDETCRGAMTSPVSASASGIQSPDAITLTCAAACVERSVVTWVWNPHWHGPDEETLSSPFSPADLSAADGAYAVCHGHMLVLLLLLLLLILAQFW